MSLLAINDEGCQQQQDGPEVEVPFEFQRTQEIDTNVTDDNDIIIEFGNLFSDPVTTTKKDGIDTNVAAATVEDDECYENVTINGKTFRLQVPVDTIGTLFCDQIWSGSKLLAEFLYSNRTQYCLGKRTIEFGSGTALPSLMSLSCHSNITIITDYPDNHIIQTIKETVGSNWSVCTNPKNRVGVIGYEWGTPVDDIHSLVQRLLRNRRKEEQQLHNKDVQNISESDDDRKESDDDDKTHRNYFDVALLSECIWMHRCHEALVQSLHELLHPCSGIAIVTYAHHIPGMEDADDHFFTLASDIANLETIRHEKYQLPYMWDTSKSIEINLRILQRKPKTTTQS